MTTWKDAQKYLSSLWLMDRDDDRPLSFHGAFVPGVAKGLILRHTKPGDWVWDPMCGSGTTGIVATALGRNVFLSDLTPVSAAEPVTHLAIRRIDARVAHLVGKEFPVLLNYAVPNSDEMDWWPRFQFDLIILHPPYHNIIRFSDKPEDLSNAPDIGTFLLKFRDVCQNAGRHLKPGGYLGLVVGDIWETKKSRVIPLGFLCLGYAHDALGGSKSRLKAIVIKDIKGNRQNAGHRNLLLSRLFRWGAVEFTHEYIFSVQKGS